MILEGITCEGCDNLKIILSLAAEQRLKTYIEHDGRESSHIEDEKNIFRFYYTLFPFYNLVEQIYQQVTNNAAIKNINISILLKLLSGNKLFDNSEFVKGMVNKRLMYESNSSVDKYVQI